MNMARKTILLLHGFASSGQSTKAQYLQEKIRTVPQVAFDAFDFNPTPKDFEYLTITGMIDRLRQYVLDRHLGLMSFVCSSLGGLVGLHYVRRYGGVERMLLLAPALSYLGGERTAGELEQWQQMGAAPIYHHGFDQEMPLQYGFHEDGLRYLERVPPPVPMTIIHGRKDEMVPIDHSREYAAQYPEQVHLIEVDSVHTLYDQLPFIWEQMRAFLIEVE
jgi:pimeloyl-ACP methyl ester carboxylesterase